MKTLQAAGPALLALLLAVPAAAQPAGVAKPAGAVEVPVVGAPPQKAPTTRPAAAPGPADEAGDDGGFLRGLLAKSGLKFQPIDETGRTFGLVFQPRFAKRTEAWVVGVQYSNRKNRDFILVFVTMLKLPADELPKRILKAAMDFNSRTPGSKMAYDQDDRSIDVQYEIPTRFATPEFLFWAVNDVVATADESYGTYKELLAE